MRIQFIPHLSQPYRELFFVVTAGANATAFQTLDKKSLHSVAKRIATFAL
jgi:hypothetical protein